MGETRREIREEGTEHEVKGGGREVAGKVQKELGKLAGDRSEQAEGAAREAAGKIEKEAGKAARRATDET